ncbi:putative RNA helicase SDE3 [Carex littledalei]|uniref:Putative RNA helicase SDE3 n=1 Tax=Carex littledalei TaxID=544730 RepID=A0A833QH50_9POAL|nr:putative RNA helicase SDE3 [Carex littledalei]
MPQPNRRANWKKKAPVPCASFESSAGSNASPIPPTLKSASLNNNLVGEFTTPPVVQSIIETSNASKSCPLSRIESNTPNSSYQTKIGSDACNGSLPSKVVSSSSPKKQDSIALVQLDVKLSASSRSCPSKALSSSSPQRPGAVSFGQFDVKSDNPKSSLPKNTVPYLSLLKPHAVSLPNKFITKTGTVSSMQWVVKSKASKNSLASKPIPTISPTPKADLSTICSTKETFNSPCIPSDADSNASKISLPSNVESNAPRSSHPTKIGSEASDSSLLCNPTLKIVPGHKKNKRPSKQPDVKLNISTNYFTPKDVSSSSPHRVDIVSFVQSDVKSNTSKSSLSTETVLFSSPLNPQAVSLPNKFQTIAPSLQCVVKSKTSKSSVLSKPIAAVSPTPKAASAPICSTKETITFPFVQSSAELNSWKTAALSEISLSNAGPGSSSSASSTNSDSSPKNETITFPFVQSSAELNSWKAAALSKMSLSNAGPGSSSSASSTNSDSSPKKVIKGDTQRYGIPKHIKSMLMNGIVPPVLHKPLSPDTYADYFATLLYAEDIYCEKWSNYLLKDVTIKLRIRQNSRLRVQSNKKKSTKSSDSETQKNYPFVVFEINDVPERRPFLLSRDHVHLRPIDKSKDFDPFTGVLVRVQKGTTFLAEFEEDFHKQHEQSKRYDVSFSFNRVCLKRAHRAVSAAANPVLHKILFPNPTSLPTPRDQVFLMDQILNHKLAPIPYLIEGSLSQRTNLSLQTQRLINSHCRHTRPDRECTKMLILIKDIVLKIYESCKESRILICAAQNSACDALVKLIMEKVCEFDVFRANAAFRDKNEVPDDIMSACRFHQECFTFPPFDELYSYRIITTTFVSTFRLHKAGLKVGHFSHIFLVDASSVIEPEMIVALADLVSEETIVVVSGSTKDKPYWIRSDIGRRHGLRKSFFGRLIKSEPYQSDNPLFITHIKA